MDLEEAQRREQENRLVGHAFAAYITGHGRKNQAFDDYCKACGLLEEDKLTKQEAADLAEYARQKADAIIAADKKGRANAKGNL